MNIISKGENRMSDIPFESKMDPKIKAIAIIIVLLVLGVVVGLVLSQMSYDYATQKTGERFKDNIQFRYLIKATMDMYRLGTIVICMNIFLLLGLLAIYVDSFRKTKSSFIFGLLLFIGVLFIQSILSLPILQAGLGFKGYDISLFGVLPNLFETIAITILLYLSME